jgi:predicted nuclease with TOPRIM domain
MQELTEKGNELENLKEMMKVKEKELAKIAKTLEKSKGKIQKKKKALKALQTQLETTLEQLTGLPLFQFINTNKQAYLFSREIR